MPEDMKLKEACRKEAFQAKESGEHGLLESPENALLIATHIAIKYGKEFSIQTLKPNKNLK
jgi:hypothetical protein